MPKFCGYCGAEGGRGGFRSWHQKCVGCENDDRKERRKRSTPLITQSDYVPQYTTTVTPPSPPQQSTGIKTYVCLSDIHIPYQDEYAVATTLEIISDLKPNGIVLLGDILDLPEVSRHNAGSVAHLEGKRLADTFTVANRFLDELGDALGPRCNERWMVAGNHEGRWDRWLATGDNVVFADDAMTSIPFRLRLPERGYVWVGNYPNGHVKLGKLLLSHGQWCGKYPSARHLERYQTSILVGHTHTQQVYHASTWDGQRAAYCQGHLADVNSEAMAYAPNPKNWVTGFSVIQVLDDGRFFVQPVNFVDGVTVYGQSVYPRSARSAA